MTGLCNRRRQGEGRPNQNIESFSHSYVSIEVIVSDEHALRAPVVWQIQKDERGDPTQEQEA